MADPSRREILKVADPRLHVRGNNVIHFVADPQVMEMYATNIPESYSCPAVDKE